MTETNAGQIAELKERVRQHWEDETCGIRHGTSGSIQRYYEEIEEVRYRNEPYLPAFADFPAGRGLRVLEIGVGAGTDFSHWVANGAQATGIDLTEAAIERTRENLSSRGLDPAGVELRVADAENLPFEDDSFDVVYSWGVLHHSPDTRRAFREAARVLRPGGRLRAMVYHLPSWSGWMLWVLHCLARGRPFRSVRRAMAEHLESPGTKAYGRAGGRELLAQAGLTDVHAEPRLGPGDLLAMTPSAKYEAPLFRLVWRLYPRWLVRLTGDTFGNNLLLSGTKPA